MSTTRPIGAAALLLASGLTAAGPAHGAASDWIVTDFSRLRLVAAGDSTAASGVLEIGVQIRLEEGWKTYWRDPGDAGLPTSFDWSASRNVGGVTLAWPAPKRLPFEGLDSYGYEGEVVFPARLRPARPGAPVRIDLAVDYAVCKDICVPLAARARLDVAAGASGAGPDPETAAHRALIRRFAARVPVRGGGMDGGMDIVGARVATGPDGGILRLHARARRPFEGPRRVRRGSRRRVLRAAEGRPRRRPPHRRPRASGRRRGAGGARGPAADGHAGRRRPRDRADGRAGALNGPASRSSGTGHPGNYRYLSHPTSRARDSSALHRRGGLE